MPIADPTIMYQFFNAMGEWRTVTITSQPGGSPSTVCTKAIRGKAAFRTLQMFSASVVRPEAMYSIPYTLASGPWKPGDTLTDANQVDATAQSSPGVTYTVMQADMDEGFWVLHVFNPKISYNLRDTATIQVATDTLTGIGTITRTFANLYANESCRIQPADSVWAMQHGRVGDNKTFDIYFANDYDLQPSKHIVVWGSNEADILNVRQRENFADLMVVTVALRPGANGTT